MHQEPGIQEVDITKMSFAHDSVSVTVLANQLELCRGSNFEVVLRYLKSPKYVKESLLKSELSLLATKILKLLRSTDNYQLWKGCHAASVICSYNPLVLCSYAGQFLAAVYSKLEQKTNYYSTTVNTQEGKVVLESLVSTSYILMELMRGKPTVSRESLVPKLKAIIPTFITLCQYQPKICLPVLKDLLYKNSTTFKPFVNKYRVVLTDMISNDYVNLDKITQSQICINYAYLHLIKIQGTPSNDDDASKAHHKTYQDDAWRAGLFSVLDQFKEIFGLCGEILDFETDNELTNLINSLPETKIQSEQPELLALPKLNLDMNSSLTLWEIPKRLNLLVDLLSAFISLPTPYPVRVPIGSINDVCDIALSMTTNFIPLKRDLRQSRELSSVIQKILPAIQYSGIQLWKRMIVSYGKHCLVYLPNMLNSLELFVPLHQKSTNIDFVKCKEFRPEFFELFSLINLLSKHLGHQINEINLFNKLIDVSLVLVEDTSLIETLFDVSNKSDLAVSGSGSGKNKKSSIKDKVGAISDIYTHPSQFVIKDSLDILNEVNKFICFVLSNWKVSGTQQVRIIKYAISRSIKCKEETGKIPTSFVKLLRTVSIYPGSEHISILPIAVELLKSVGDQVFDVLIHPRLPMSTIYQVSRPPQTQVTDIVEKNDMEDDNFGESVDLSTVGEIPETVQEEDKMEQVIENELATSKMVTDETKIFKKREIEVQEEPQENKRMKIESTSIVDSKVEISEIQNTIVSEVVTSTTSVENTVDATNNSDDDESEFEIPEIALSEDEDED